MESTLVKCSMCQTRDMVRAPHKDGPISGTVFMICLNCDGPTACTVPNCDEPVCKARPVSVIPPNDRQYLGTGPNSDRP